MKHAETVTFGGSGLNRAAELRGDAAAIEALLARSGTGVLAIWRGKPLLSDETRAPVFLAPDHPLFSTADEAAVFLGLDDDRPRFARDISGWEPVEVPDTLGAFVDLSEQAHPDVDGAAFAELRANMTGLTPRDAELVVTSKAILGWHETHGFCAYCGAKTQIGMAGWQRDCPDCDRHHFPRTDPVVIMLITHGNSVLVGRSPAWPEGMFSLLAGFVEPGESIEGAVRREVFEEVGVRVGRVDYLSSQPWPFPSSLMFGCHGHATSTAIKIDPNEIEEARWVNREDMLEALSGRHSEIKPARRGAIARFLIEHWLADTLG
ncbi:MAG: NAD(+) diphosphatase [Silicimonas sp.]|nr:NAD(+) diphosphatase [Silicimonas sp.]